MYYMGYIRNTQCIKAHFSDGWLGFGFSDIRGTCKYILKSMRKVIRGDYSSIREQPFFCCRQRRKVKRETGC